VFDAAWAFIAPWLALWMRDAQVLSANDWPIATGFCAIAFVSALFAFLVFRIRDGMTDLFSVHDALEVAKAVLLSAFITYLVVFSVTRLEGIPRSTPLIHALLLAAGLVSARALVRMAHSGRAPASAGQVKAEHIIIIGSNKLSSLYINFLQAYAPDRHRVIALLDDRSEMIGRSVSGVRVLGPSFHLLPVIEEFKEHGIHTDRIIVGGEADILTPEAMREVERIGREFNLQLDFVPRLIGLPALQPRNAEGAMEPTYAALPPDFALNRYLLAKRSIDFSLSLLLIVALLPLFVVIAALVLLDVGSPVFFWQRRIGMNGQSFQMHKFRTLKPAYDWQGHPVSSDRVSWLGELLRKVRLDELPQLLNVLVGDMSLIGPRPLLPHDQPADPTLRLTVRPGITGWAQVNGGKLLTSEEKNAFDEWYIHNASAWLDLKIVAMTILFLMRREGRQASAAMAMARRAVPAVAARSTTESAAPDTENTRTAAAGNG
jgi:lipopolysaccharide/colanic/teichoic acid biosynthesis glycosyltransferase